MSESQTKAGNQRKFENFKFKIAQVDPRDMLNNFCFHVYAEKSLFIAENCNAFFFTSAASCELANPRAGSHLTIVQFSREPLVPGGCPSQNLVY